MASRAASSDFDDTAVRELASREWGLPPGEVMISDGSERAPEVWFWLQRHRFLILWATPGGRPIPRLPVVTSDVGAIVLRPEGRAGLAQGGGMFRARSPAEEPALHALVRDHCVDPVIGRDGPDWTLTFFAFNRAGGIERWELTGRDTKLQTARHQVVAPNGTGLAAWG